MIPIWNMWRAIRMLRTSQHTLAFDSLDEKHKSDVKIGADAFSKAILNLYTSNNRLSVPRYKWMASVTVFMVQRRYFFVQRILHPIIWLRGELYKSRGVASRGLYDFGIVNTAKSNDIIQNCFAAGYVETVDNQRDLIRITKSGLDFSYFDGLLIALANHLKPLGIAGILGSLWTAREFLLPVFLRSLS